MGGSGGLSGTRGPGGVGLPGPAPSRQPSRGQARPCGEEGPGEPGGRGRPSAAKLLLRAAETPASGKDLRPAAPPRALLDLEGRAALSPFGATPRPGGKGQVPERGRPGIGALRGGMFPALSEPPLSHFPSARRSTPPFVLPSWPRLLLREACRVQLRAWSFLWITSQLRLGTQLPRPHYSDLRCGDSQASLQNP